jgi:hypothetical protein|tara:strand:- start:2344 stop:2511 length:168 start_codon:yes stop_codon:yes gene_type:complete
MDKKSLIEYESPLGTKTEIVLFRLTEEEKRLLFNYAQKLGISTSALLRYMLSKLS